MKVQYVPGIDVEAALDPQGGNCVIKALLMNSATKLPFWHKGQLGPEDDHEVPLDYMQGAGMVNAVASYDLLAAGQQGAGTVLAHGWDLNDLSTSSPAEVYEFSVYEPNQMITATLSWNRHYDLTS